jgi:two-component system, chemotaxis family, CheB/CheR fusion protein
MAKKHNEAAPPSLVVVGSSAGGIEALSTLVATLPTTFPAPVVLAQHLDPRYPSHLGEILARRTHLPVCTVIDAEQLRPGTIYVIPADRDVEITDHEVRLRADSGKRPKPSVDRLLASAAHAYGERLIAVILTGTGSDGATGAHAVKAAGGMVVIENPATAAYPGMPESLAATTVDLMADLERIGPLLHNLLSGTYLPTQPDVEESLQALLTQVRERNGIDFSQYKQPTILRRLQRRMVAVGMPTLPDYLRYLARHSEEYSRLIASFLIHVTEFFRDPKLFAALREEILPELIADKRTATMGNELRIWSAGCATGEEAYSLAILVAEALGMQLTQFKIHIFATDLDEEAVAFARRGVYPAVALVNIPEELRSRYFTRLDGSYEVTSQLRSLVIFGQHDLGQRAPFPHIDLVLCRNVLIYFTPELQQRALHIFAFALRDGGYLALGKAETVRPLEAYFAPAHERLKLYRRQGDRVLPPIARRTMGGLQPRTYQPVPHVAVEPTVGHNIRNGATSFRSIGERLGNLILESAVGVVVVDRQYDIQIINSAAIRLLGIYTAAIGKDLIHLVETIPATGLRAAIDAAFQLPTSRHDESDTIVTVVTVETALGEQQRLQIACYPHIDTAGAQDADLHGVKPHITRVLLVVSDVTRHIQEQTAAEANVRHQAVGSLAKAEKPGDLGRAYQASVEENARLRAQVEEISAVNRRLLHDSQELVEANMELRGANEDLLVGREEAEASSEEVKTLNEELQATNEELVTVNEEMEATVEELHTANDDLAARSRELQQSAVKLEEQHQASEAARAQLEAILLSMSDALLVVDAHGTRILTNAAYARMFGGDVIAEDAQGEPLPAEMQPQQQAVTGSPFTLAFTLTADKGMRRWFEATGQPVRYMGIEGGVVSIRDITERRLRLLQEEFLALATHELRSPLTSLLLALQMLTQRSLSDMAGADVQRTLRLALRQAQRLRVLVNDLLDVSRVQQGKLHLQLVPVDFVALVYDAVEAVQLDVQGQAIILDPGIEPLVVMADAPRLEQVVLNLLTNAIKFAPDTQRIDVHLRRAEAISGAGHAEAILQVQDYGPGIFAAELPQVFTRYFQSAHTTAHEGLGLGLFITKELVTAHGGNVSVVSMEGQGATFTVRLPLYDGTQDAQDAQGDFGTAALPSDPPATPTYSSNTANETRRRAEMS